MLATTEVILYKPKRDYSWKKDSYQGVDYTNGGKLASECFVESAISEAKKSNMIQKHGCVIVSKNKIIARGYNTCVESSYRISVHAEQDALNKLKGKFSNTTIKNCKLYIVRIGQTSMGYPLKYSKPCPRCANNIIKTGIKTVYYSTNYEFDDICSFL
jgi:deoxycytidylate deaminase